MKRKVHPYVRTYVRSCLFQDEKLFALQSLWFCVAELTAFILQGSRQGTVITTGSIFLYSPMSHHSNNSTTPIDKLLSRWENITLISFHLAAMQKAWLINVCNEGYQSAQIFGSKGNLSLLCNCRASHITRLFSALAVNNSPHQS